MELDLALLQNLASEWDHKMTRNLLTFETCCPRESKGPTNRGQVLGIVVLYIRMVWPFSTNSRPSKEGQRLREPVSANL